MLSNIMSRGKMTQIAKGGEYEDYLAQQTLAFTHIKQSAFLGFLFDESNGLYKHYASLMDASWFSSPEHQMVFKAFQDFVNTYKKLPTHVALKEDNLLLKKETPVVARIRATIDAAIADRSQFLVEQLINELEDWKNAKIFHKAFDTGVKAYNGGKFDECARIFKESIKTSSETSFIKSEVKKASDTQEILDAINGSATIPFGLRLIDNHLFEDNAKGGLQLGDQTLLMGSSNGGKTACILTTCIHNVRAENHTMLMTHEGTHQDIRQKYIRCYLTLMDIGEAQKVMQCDENKAKAYVAFCRLAGSSRTMFTKALTEDLARLTPFLAQIDKYLTYLPYHRAGMEVEKIIPIIERHQSFLND